MKKFTLTLLLLLAGIPTLFAQQTVRNDIFAYLKHEGYAPALDKDSDIEFKIQGILYNIIVKQIENEDYAYVEVLANFGTVTPYDKLMEIANDINQNKFVCKCSVSRNEVPGIKNRGVKKCKAKDNQIIMHFSSVPLF